MKRFISVLLTVIMVINMIPNSLISVYATNTDTADQAVEEVIIDDITAPEPSEEPAEQPAEEPASEPSAEPAEEPAEELVEEPVEEPAGEPVEEPVEEPTEEPVDEPSAEPSAELSEEPAQEIPLAGDVPSVYAPWRPGQGGWEDNYDYDHIDVKIPAQYHVTVDGVDYVFTGAFDSSTIVVTIKGTSSTTADKVYTYEDYIGTRNFTTRSETDGSGNTINEYNISLGDRGLNAEDFTWTNQSAYNFGTASNIYIDGRIYFTATSATAAALALVFPYDSAKGQYYLQLDDYKYTSVNECTNGNGMRSDGGRGTPSGLDMYLKIADVGTYITTGRMSIDKVVLNQAAVEITPNVNFRYTVEMMSNGVYTPVYFTNTASGIVYDGTSSTAGNTNIITVNPSVGPTVISGLPVGQYRITELQTEGYVIVSAEGNTGADYTLDYVVEYKDDENIPVATFTNQQLTTTETGLTVKKTVSGLAAGYQDPTFAIYEDGVSSPLWSMTVEKDVTYYPAITLEAGKTYTISETNEAVAGYVSTRTYSVTYGGTVISTDENGSFTVPADATGKIINIVVNNEYAQAPTPKGNLTIIKVFEDEAGNILPQTLTGFPTHIDLAISDYTGVVALSPVNSWSTTIYNIEEGTYTVTEDLADAQIPGYTLVDTAYAHKHDGNTVCTTGAGSNTIDAHASEDTLIITNIYSKNVAAQESVVHDTVEINKLDTDSVKLAGAEFGLYTGYDPRTKAGTGTLIGTFTTDANGRFVISTEDIASAYLPTDADVTYYLVETKAPDYYLTPAQYGSGVYNHPVKISVSKAEQLINNEYVTVVTYTATVAGSSAVEIINMKNVVHTAAGSTAITKVDGTTDAAMADVEFKLWSDSECTNLITTLKTDADGKLTIDLEQLAANNVSTAAFTGIATTVWYMTETTPNGYAKNDTVYTVVFTPNGSTEPEKVTGENYFKVIHNYEITVYDGQAEAETIINTRNEAVVHIGQVGPVVKTDVLTGEKLAGVKFVLYAKQDNDPANAIVEYITDAEGEFIINIDDLTTATAATVLANAGLALPTAKDVPITLYLQESQPLAGYAANETFYPVTVTLSDISEPELKDEGGVYAFITTYTYTMTFVERAVTLPVTNTNKGHLEINKIIKVNGTTDNDFLEGKEITVRVTTLDANQNYTGVEGWTEYKENGQSLTPQIWYKDVTLAYNAENGYTATLENLIPGDYQVTEIVTDGMYVDGYALTVHYEGTNHDDATVVAGKTVTETITNAYTTVDSTVVHSELTIFKIDAESHAYLKGAKFILYADSALATEINELELESDEDGKVIINTKTLEKHLPVTGSTTLYLKEAVAPAGYTPSAQVYEVVITTHTGTGSTGAYKYYTIAAKYLGAGDEYLRDEVTVENTKIIEKEYGTALFYKIDGEDKISLENAQFTLYGDADFVITTGYSVTSGPDGKVVIDTKAMEALGLLPQIGENVTYYLKETVVPDGYIAPENPVKIIIYAQEALPEGGTAYIVEYTTELIGADEVYEVSGTEAPAFANDRDKVDVFTYNNVNIAKYNDAGLPIHSTNPATFAIYPSVAAAEAGTSPLHTFTAGEYSLSAESFINHIMGDADFVDAMLAKDDNASTTVYLKEIRAPVGYVIDETVHEITVKGTASEHVYNEDTKLWERTFHIEIAEIGSLVPANGQYRIINNRDFLAPVVTGDTLSITKVDPQGNLLDGAQFQLANGEVIADFTAGQYTLSTEDEIFVDYLAQLAAELAAAERADPSAQSWQSSEIIFALEEIMAPHGYYITDKVYNVELSASMSIIWNGASQKFQRVTAYSLKEVITTEDGIKHEYDAINVVNNLIGADRLIISKVAVGGITGLEGAQFTLYWDERASMPVDGGVFTTDEDGYVSISTDSLKDSLPAEGGGVFLWLKETKAPAGYTMEDKLYPVNIVAIKENGVVNYSFTADGKEVLTVENIPQQTVTVKKQWINETNPQPVQVQLYKDGAEYGAPVQLSADNNWYYKWDALPGDGEYTVKEINVPDNYVVATDEPVNNSFVITNTKITVTPTPGPTPYSPNTSDSTNLFTWVSITVLAAVVLAVVALLKKKVNKEQ